MTPDHAAATSQWRVGATLSHLAAITGGKILRGAPGVAVDSLFHDTRAAGRGAMFVAIVGERFDGHQCLAQAVEKGAIGAMISQPVETTGLPEPFFLLQVDDTVAALGRLAMEARRKINTPVIAVAGSGGKTTTKEWIAHLLSVVYGAHRTPGNQNNLIGLPLALLEMTPRHDMAVFELGMNQPGELGQLTTICQPTIGVLTNVGRAHLGMFASEAALVEAKSEFIAALPEDALIIYNADCERSRAILQKRRGSRVAWSVGLAMEADFRIFDIQRHGEGYRFGLQHGIETLDFAIPGFGKYNVHNAVMAIAVAIEMRLDVAMIAKHLQTFQTPDMRSQLLQIGGVQIIADCYNASPDGMAAALASLGEWPARGRKFVALGDMFELGESGPDIHAAVGALFGRYPVDGLLLVGPLMTRHTARAAEEAGQAVERMRDPQQAAQRLADLVQPGDVALVKGSRGMRMETIVEGLRARLASPSEQA